MIVIDGRTWAEARDEHLLELERAVQDLRASLGPFVVVFDAVVSVLAAIERFLEWLD